MTPVEGKYVVLELFVGDGFFPLLCGTDMSFHVQQEVVYKTGPNSGSWREKVTRLSEWIATVTGLTMVENAETLTFFWALQDSVRLKKQYIRMTFKDIDGNGKQITGYAYVTSNDINGPATDFSSATIVLEGTGAFSMGEIVPPETPEFEYFSDYWNFIGSGTAGTSAEANYNVASLFGQPEGTLFTFYSPDDCSVPSLVLGTYTVQAGDTTSTILRDNIVAAIATSALHEGYLIVSVSSTEINITAPVGCGASLNGKDFLVTFGFSTSSTTFDSGVDGTLSYPNYIQGASSGLSSSAVAHGSAFTLGTTDIILEVDVEGVQFDVLATGTPSGRECVFNPSLGKITFPSDLIFDGMQRVFVEFKRTA